jgi:hypothetical protein
MAFEAEERFRPEKYKEASFKEGNDDSYLLNRFRWQMDLRFDSWFSVITQVQDARPFLENPPIGPPNENRWDLKTAYAEVGDPEEHWINIRIGRQLMNYNNTLIANSEWRNQGRSYDAVVANLHAGPYRLGIFAASGVVPLASGISHHQEGNNIYGLYGRLDNLLPNSSFEHFLLWRVQPKATVEGALSSRTGKQNMFVPGLRLKGKVGNALDYSIEGAFEVGTVGSENIRAWATTDGVAYEFTSLWSSPRIFAQYDFASGNQNPSGGTHHTFDTIYPTAHDRFGILDLFGWQNIQSYRYGGTAMPHRRLTLTSQYLDFWVDSHFDAVYNSSGSVISSTHGKAGSHLGEEVDAYSWYELNRHVNIGIGSGWFGAGGFVADIATGHSYSSAYIAINFKDLGKSQEESGRTAPGFVKRKGLFSRPDTGAAAPAH